MRERGDVVIGVSAHFFLSNVRVSLGGASLCTYRSSNVIAHAWLSLGCGARLSHVVIFRRPTLGVSFIF